MSKKYFSGVKSGSTLTVLYAMDIVMFGGVIKDIACHNPLFPLKRSSSACMKVKTAWDLLAAGARRWSGEISVMLLPRSRAPRSLSCAGFARVLIDFRKEKENNVCAQANTDMQFCFVVFFSFHL